MTAGLTPTDETLFQRYRDRGDEGSLRALLDRHWAASYRIALAITRDPASAEDVAQEAFVRVVEAARRGRELASFEGWLRAVVVNGARKGLRSKKRRQRHEEVAMNARPEAAPETDSTRAVREHADALPEKLRLPLVLHFGLGLSHQEVGEAVGCPTGTAASRIRLGLERIRGGLATAGLLLAVEAIAAVLAAKKAEALEAAVPAAPAVETLVANAGKGGLAASLAVPLAAAALALAGAALLLVEPRQPPAGGGARAGVARPQVAPVGTFVPLPPPPPPEGGVGAPGTFVSKTTPGGAASISTTGTARRPAPPYPWKELGDKLNNQRLEATFADTPLKEVLDFFRDIGAATVELHPSLAALGETPVRMTVRRTRTSIALGLVVETLRAREPVALHWVDEGKLRIVPEKDAPRGLRANLNVKALVRAAGETRDDDGPFGAETKVTLALDGLALEDLGAQLLKAVEVNAPGLALGRGVDPRLVLRYACKEKPLAAALDELTERHGLAWRALDGTILIETKGAPRLADRTVTLGLRDVTIAELIVALDAQGIEAVCPEWDWTEDGTFSLPQPTDSIRGLQQTIAEATAGIVRTGTTFVHGEPRREVLVIEGGLTSPAVRRRRQPPPFPGVVAEVEELRAKLDEAVLARGTLPRDAERPAITAADRRVHATERALSELIEAARRYERLPEEIKRWEAAPKYDASKMLRDELAKKKEEIARREATLAELDARGGDGERDERPDLKRQLANAKANLKELELRLAELERKDDRPPGPTREQLLQVVENLKAGARLAEAERQLPPR